MIRGRLGVGGVIVGVSIVGAACSGSVGTPPTAGVALAPTSSIAPVFAAPSSGPTTIPAVSFPAGVAAQGSGVNVAAIVTPDVAASVIGGTISTTTSPGVPGFSMVQYGNESGATFGALIESIPGQVTPEFLQEAMSMAGTDGTMQTFGGLGDTAGKVVNENDATVVFAKGTTIVVLEADSDAATGTELDSRIEGIAHQIADKI